MPAEPPGSLAGAVAIRHSQVWPGTGELQQGCPGARGRAISGQAAEEVASKPLWAAAIPHCASPAGATGTTPAELRCCPARQSLCPDSCELTDLLQNCLNQNKLNSSSWQGERGLRSDGAERFFSGVNGATYLANNPFINSVVKKKKRKGKKVCKA